MNKILLTGRITKDPETKFTTSGKQTTSFTLAVDRRFKKDETDFIKIVTWEKTADFCSKYFIKGQKVLVSGSLQTRTWEDSNGQKRYVTEVIADEVEFADGKKEGNTNYTAPAQTTDGFCPAEDDDELPF